MKTLRRLIVALPCLLLAVPAPDGARAQPALDDMVMFFKGQQATGQNVQPPRMRKWLSDILQPQQGWTDRQHIDAITSQMAQLDDFKGSGGLLSWVILRAGGFMLEGGDDFPPNAIIRIDATGIIDATDQDGQPGYQYNNQDKSGQVSNTMCFDFERLGGGKPGPIGFVSYDIKTTVTPVDGLGFVVYTEKAPNGTFVGADTPVRASIAMNYMSKLEVVNENCNGCMTVARIDIKDVEDESQSCANHTAPWTQLDPQQYAFFFDLEDRACIDMMFKTATPPATLPTDPADRPAYCLGRCTNPPIVNTY